MTYQSDPRHLKLLGLLRFAACKEVTAQVLLQSKLVWPSIPFVGYS